MEAGDGLNEARDAGGRAPQAGEEPPGLEGGDGLLDQGADLRVGPVDRLLPCGKGLPAAPARDTDRTPGTSTLLVRPALDVSVRESADDAVLTGGPDVVDGTGQSRRGPQQPAAGIGQDLHVPPVLPVLPVLSAVEGPVGGDPVDRQQRAVQRHECLGRCRPGRLRKRGGEGGQEVDGLGDAMYR